MQEKEFVDFCVISAEDYTRIIPPEQGYSNCDETQTTGLMAAEEGKMLFMLHTWEMFVSKKRGMECILCLFQEVPARSPAQSLLLYCAAASLSLAILACSC